MSMRFGLHAPEQVLRYAEQWGSGTRLILAEVNGTGGWLPALRLASVPLQPGLDWRLGGTRTLLLLPRSMAAYGFIAQWASRMRSENRVGDPSDWQQAPLHPEVDVIFPFSVRQSAH